MFKNFKEKKLTRRELFQKNSGDIIGEKQKMNKNNKGSLSRLVLLIIFIIIIISALNYKGYNDFKTDILVVDEVLIEVQEGDIPSDIANKLGLNKNYLKVYLKNNNPEFELLAGNFNIHGNSNIEQILDALETPIIQGEINVTLLEGWNIYDMDEYLTSKKLINENEYISYVTDLEKIEKLTEFFPFIKGLETLEGFLYPDTYKVVSDNFKINTFVIKQLENFENKVYKSILLKLDNKKIEDLINLSSIVEKEEKNVDEKPTVAGILKKRLENGWMIGADITVCYPHELTANECKMVISKYINEKSEYNTRTKQGLPKTPIGNPSFETINATLNSKDSKYWFYLHDTVSGKIYYAGTNAEHEKNKSLYLR